MKENDKSHIDGFVRKTPSICKGESAIKDIAVTKEVFLAQLEDVLYQCRMRGDGKQSQEKLITCVNKRLDDDAQVILALIKEVKEVRVEQDHLRIANRNEKKQHELNKFIFIVAVVTILSLCMIMYL